MKNFFNYNIKQNINFGNGQGIYAGFAVRLVATFIDILVTTPLILAMFYIVGLDFTAMPTTDQMLDQIFSNAQPVQNTTQKIADFISWIILISYSVYFLTSNKQATPGKRIMNIYVGTRDGQKLSVNRCFARFFASILSSALFGIGFLMIAFTKEKTALHDIICDTRVFYGKR